MCMRELSKYCKKTDLIIDYAAGAGALLDAAERAGYEAKGYDIDPQRADIIKRELHHFDGTRTIHLNNDRQVVAFINPPFEYGRNFIDTVLEADNCTYAGAIISNGIIRDLKKYPIQRAKLVFFMRLPLKGYTFKGRDYDIATWFVIYSKDADECECLFDKLLMDRNDDF